VLPSLKGRCIYASSYQSVWSHASAPRPKRKIVALVSPFRLLLAAPYGAHSRAAPLHINLLGCTTMPLSEWSAITAPFPEAALPWSPFSFLYTSAELL